MINNNNNQPGKLLLFVIGAPLVDLVHTSLATKQLKLNNPLCFFTDLINTSEHWLIGLMFGVAIIDNIDV